MYVTDEHPHCIFLLKYYIHIFVYFYDVFKENMHACVTLCLFVFNVGY
jgi:hypothetical protein